MIASCRALREKSWMAGVVALALASATCGRPPLATVGGGSAGARGGAGSGIAGSGPASGGAGAAGTGTGESAGAAGAGMGGSAGAAAGEGAGGASPSPGDTTANPRFVFVSSTVYQGSELGGLAGADAKCQALASAAGLPGTYQAWLSDVDNSPRQRFRKDGGPFRLVDGSLVAESWKALVTGPLRHAIDRTETGDPPPRNVQCGWPDVVWTDTAGQGFTASGASNCRNWSDANANALCGQSTSQDQWTGRSILPCACSAAIYCFEQDGPDLTGGAAGVPDARAAPPFPCEAPGCAPGPKTVFVTSKTFTADLGGLLGADAQCQALATAAGLSGTYFAWLSDFQGSPATRFSRAGRPYRLVDGSVVADDWTALTAGVLRHAIDRTETGGPPPLSPRCGALDPSAWTNTGTDGATAGDAYACGDWTDTLAYGGLLGNPSSQTSAWTIQCFFPGCDGTATLYCFEQ